MRHCAVVLEITDVCFMVFKNHTREAVSDPVVMEVRFMLIRS